MATNATITVQCNLRSNHSTLLQIRVEKYKALERPEEALPLC